MPQIRFGLRNSGVKAARVSNGVASGHVAVKSSGVDQGRNDCVAFLLLMGAMTGAPTVKLQGCNTNVDGDFVDLAGTGVTMTGTDDNSVLLLELVRPIHRYNRLVWSPDGTNDCVIDGIMSFLYNGSDQPPLSDGLHASSKVIITPAAGTP